MSTLDDEIAALLHATPWDGPAPDDAVIAELRALLHAVKTTPTAHVFAKAVKATKPPRPTKVPKPAAPVLTEHQKWLNKQRSLVLGLQTRITKYERDLAYGREHPEDSAHALFNVVEAECALPGVRVRLQALEETIARVLAREAASATTTQPTLTSHPER